MPTCATGHCVRADDPSERIDTENLEVMIDLDEAPRLVPAPRVRGDVEAAR
jgi:hypothetical protein